MNLPEAAVASACADATRRSSTGPVDGSSAATRASSSASSRATDRREDVASRHVQAERREADPNRPEQLPLPEASARRRGAARRRRPAGLRARRGRAPRAPFARFPTSATSVRAAAMSRIVERRTRGCERACVARRTGRCELGRSSEQPGTLCPSRAVRGERLELVSQLRIRFARREGEVARPFSAGWQCRGEPRMDEAALGRPRPGEHERAQ